MSKKNIEVIFRNYFGAYCFNNKKENLEFVKTSGDRQGDVKSNPHALPGHAMDFILRLDDDYAPIKEYDELFKFLMAEWPYRAGIDNTTGNIHIHIDFGENRPEGQELPFFFLEDDGKFKKQLTSPDEL